MTDDEMWKKRFLILMMVRVIGTALVLFGMVIAFSNVVEPGGNRPVGVTLIAAGLLELTLVPRTLLKRWRQP